MSGRQSVPQFHRKSEYVGWVAKALASVDEAEARRYERHLSDRLRRFLIGFGSSVEHAEEQVHLLIVAARRTARMNAE